MSLPLLAELKRRRVFRALIGYGLAAFAVLQISEPMLGLMTALRALDGRHDLIGQIRASAGAGN